jgi:hypothetical protein
MRHSSTLRNCAKALGQIGGTQLLRTLAEFERQGLSEIDLAEGIYWFASANHGGQWTTEYELLSLCEFEPGPFARGPQSGLSEVVSDLILRHSR